MSQQPGTRSRPDSRDASRVGYSHSAGRAGSLGIGAGSGVATASWNRNPYRGPVQRRGSSAASSRRHPGGNQARPRTLPPASAPATTLVRVTITDADGALPAADFHVAIEAFVREVIERSESPEKEFSGGFSYVIEMYRTDGGKPEKFVFTSDDQFFEPGGQGHGRWARP